MKRNFFGSYKIYPLKHLISKFEIAGVKIADFVSAKSWAILPLKMIFESGSQNATDNTRLPHVGAKNSPFHG